MLLPIQHSSTLRAKRKLGIARAGSGKLLACALAIVALILCLYKYHQVCLNTATVCGYWHSRSTLSLSFWSTLICKVATAP